MKFNMIHIIHKNQITALNEKDNFTANLLKVALENIFMTVGVGKVFQNQP